MNYDKYKIFEFIELKTLQSNNDPVYKNMVLRGMKEKIKIKIRFILDIYLSEDDILQDKEIKAKYNKKLQLFITYYINYLLNTENYEELMNDYKDKNELITYLKHVKFMIYICEQNSIEDYTNQIDILARNKSIIYKILDSNSDLNKISNEINESNEYIINLEDFEEYNNYEELGVIIEKLTVYEENIRIEHIINICNKLNIPYNDLIIHLRRNINKEMNKIIVAYIENMKKTEIYNNNNPLYNNLFFTIHCETLLSIDETEEEPEEELEKELYDISNKKMENTIENIYKHLVK